MSEAGDPALIGRRVAGKFVVEKFLGGGAMGAVYRARDDTLDRNVALKVMHPTVAVDPSFVSRFHREARAASRLEHPNSMHVIEFGQEPDGLLYIAMEYLEGRDLYRVIHEDWPLPEARIADVMMKALAAIAVAHEMGVIHRDLKPENIMILNRKDDDGQDLVKVCDFGIAKITEKDEGAGATPRTAGQKLTTAGLVVGTPEYMSPEQARGEKLDARSDLYSMGIILYQLLTGRTPFLADTALAVVLKHINDEPEPPSSIYPEVHKGLESVCLRALAKKREDRFQSAREMRSAIRAVMEGRPLPAPGALATTAAGAAAKTPSGPPEPSSTPPGPNKTAPMNALTEARAAAIAAPAAPREPAKVTPLGTAQAPPEEKKRSRALLVVAIAAVLAVVAGVVYVSGSSSAPSPAVTPTPEPRSPSARPSSRPGPRASSSAAPSASGSEEGTEPSSLDAPSTNSTEPASSASATPSASASAHDPPKPSKPASSKSAGAGGHNGAGGAAPSHPPAGAEGESSTEAPAPNATTSPSSPSPSSHSTSTPAPGGGTHAPAPSTSTPPRPSAKPGAAGAAHPSGRGSSAPPSSSASAR